MTASTGAGVPDPGREKPPDPSAVWQTIAGYQYYWAAVAAVELGLFDALARSHAQPEELGPDLGCEPGRLTLLCDVLVASGLLLRSPAGTAGAFGLSDTAATYLVSGAERSMRDLLLRSPGSWENWPALASTLRGDEPPIPVDTAFYAGLVRATFPTQYAAAGVLATRLPAAGRVLDLGAGAAPWSIAILEAFPSATGVALDLPEVLPAAEDTTARHALADRLELVAGDYWDTTFEAGSFDVVVLGHVLRAEGHRAAELVRRAAATLSADGTLVVADYFVDDDHRGPVNSLLLGLTMMSATTEGRTFTRAEHRVWFETAGLTDIALHDLTPGQQAMTCRSPRAQPAQSRKEPS